MYIKISRNQDFQNFRFEDTIVQLYTQEESQDCVKVEIFLSILGMVRDKEKKFGRVGNRGGKVTEIQIWKLHFQKKVSFLGQKLFFGKPRLTNLKVLLI